MNTISKGISRALNRTKLNHYTRLYDYKSDFTTDTKFIFDTLRSCKMPELFFKDMMLVPYGDVNDAFGVVNDLPLHTDKHEKAMGIDTTMLCRLSSRSELDFTGSQYTNG